MVTSQLTASAKALGPVPIEGDGGGAGVPSPVPLTNRLKESQSPFLAAAATSPVAWQPLDNVALDRARAENKLIFMHVGYLACHHCHLMATDSFNSQPCAEILNESFVPVLVDREQRPDIDNVYMNYVQGVSGSGGWPLNIFVTAEMEPVFGGSYFPGAGSSQPPTGENEEVAADFLTVLKKVREAWLDQESRCRKEAAESLAQLRNFAAEGTLGTKSITTAQSIAPVSQGLTAAPAPTTGDAPRSTISSELDLDQLEEAYRNIAGTFDPLFGGFGLAPKFPTPPKLAFLLNLARAPADVLDVVGQAECNHAGHIALDTLRKIRDGAMRDHVSGNGFGRFSITSDWSIPNFERLTVDNALLLSLYLEAWSLNGGKKDEEFHDVAEELVQYLVSEPVVLAGGAFASSQAAGSLAKRGDRNLREGAYYTWTSREFESAVATPEQPATSPIAAYFGVLEDGNVDQQYDPNDDFINQNIIRVTKSAEEIAKQFNVPLDSLQQQIVSAKKLLREKAQRERPTPQLDDKVITGWNGLIISSLARAVSNDQFADSELRQKVLQQAQAATHFIQSNLWDPNSQKLYRVWHGEKDTEAFADDYAYLIQGLLDLHHVTGDEANLEFADILQKLQIQHFYDETSGGFFSSAEDCPNSPIRLKDGMDTSLPSVNAISVSNLFRLSSLLDDERFSTVANETINAFEPEMLQYPWLYPGLLGGVVTARLGGEKPAAEVKYKASRQKA